MSTPDRSHRFRAGVGAYYNSRVAAESIPLAARDNGFAARSGRVARAVAARFRPEHYPRVDDSAGFL